MVSPGEGLWWWSILDEGVGLTDHVPRQTSVQVGGGLVDLNSCEKPIGESNS